MTKYWTTIVGRVIPIKYMTTTHLGNAMHYCDKNKIQFQKVYLLEEWLLREKEGIWRKACRFAGRVAGRYYTKKLPKDPYASRHIHMVNTLEFENEFDYN